MASPSSLSISKQGTEEMENKEKLAASSCDHVAVVEAIHEGRERVNQLRALLLSSAGHLSELAGGLFDESLQSFSMAISMLQGSSRLESYCSPAASFVTSSSSDEPKSKNLDKKRENREVGDKSTGRKRRRTQHSWSIETCIPHYDGHQWRKYGQKDIRGFKHPRSYFKCTFRDSQGCQATKTVQEKDDANPPKYIIAYDGQHSCKPMETKSPFVVIDSTPGSASDISFDDKSSGSLLSPLAPQDQGNNSTPSWDPAEWNEFLPLVLTDGSLELISDELSWIPGCDLF